MIPTKFRIIWLSSFRGKDFLEIDQSETRIACCSHVYNWIGTKLALFIENRSQMLPTKFRFIWPSGFRGEESQKSTNQEQELPVVVMFVNGSGQNEQSLQRTFHGCFLPSFGSFGKAVSEEKIFFRNQPIRNKNCLWWPCLLMDLDEMSNRNRRFSIDASYQVSVHLAKWLQRRRIACGGHVW